MHAGNDHDAESGLLERSEHHPPPPWADTLEEAQYIITRLRTKIGELKACQERHVQRPALDEAVEETHISRLTADVGRQFNHAHRHVTAIKAQAKHGTKMEQKLAQNVILALVTTLQDLSVTFRMAQSNYLKSITSREERSNAYFELPNFEELSLNDSELLPGLTNNQTDLLFTLGPSTSGIQTTGAFTDTDGTIDEVFQKPALSQKQLLLMQEDNTRMVAEREQEVNKIVRSIMDLNDVFKDLTNMVHEQGTVLDRIDYNIEQTQVQVHEGYKQLQKAEHYQKKNRKIHCILCLGVTILVLVILLIIVKE
ncbi:Syntaxin-16 [Eumeta japonica]|uniref:Syntaxin-16 n=1 Tax=Eumeta variegata TaxID=151549 RepID=A0A4C1ZH97_EUMVA|nr:Syntaxin-16 [Eumeta japonica]